MTSCEGLAAIRETAREVMPTASSRTSSASRASTSQEGNSLAFAFGLAVIIIYLVLAAQFESFREPLIIMMAVPLSIFGALIPLYLGFGTLNIYTQGRPDHARRPHHQARHLDGAIRQAAARDRDRPPRRSKKRPRVRLRPILMTTAAMVLGVVPLIIATGAGAAARHAIGIVIAMGMGVGTLFTLFVVPTFYTYIAPATRRRPGSTPRSARSGAGGIRLLWPCRG